MCVSLLCFFFFCRKEPKCQPEAGRKIGIKTKLFFILLNTKSIFKEKVWAALLLWQFLVVAVIQNENKR